MISISNLCTGCRACFDACPVSCFSLKNNKAVANSDCISCELCVSTCPINAISMVKPVVVEKTIFKEVKTDGTTDSRI